MAAAEVQALVARLYGIDGSVKALAGERDQNCGVESADGTRYVFKISNPSEPVSLVDFQIAALEHIARTSPGQPVPRVVRMLDGRARDTVQRPADRGPPAGRIAHPGAALVAGIGLTVRSSPMRSAVFFDRFDLKIMVHLQREGRCSNVDLAESIGLSPSPCLLRTKRLQETGLIRGYSADIALDKLGECVVVFSEITISSHRPDDFRKFEEGAGK